MWLKSRNLGILVTFCALRGGSCTNWELFPAAGSPREPRCSVLCTFIEPAICTPRVFIWTSLAPLLQWDSLGIGVLLQGFQQLSAERSCSHGSGRWGIPGFLGREAGAGSGLREINWLGECFKQKNKKGERCKSHKWQRTRGLLPGIPEEFPGNSWGNLVFGLGSWGWFCSHRSLCCILQYLLF